jgi:transcription elongation factor GreA
MIDCLSVVRVLTPARATPVQRTLGWSVMASTQLSRAAYERLRVEYEDLTTRGRIEVAQKIESARLLGDLSENGDYHAAKDEQGHMEGRIRQLEHLLETSEIIEGGGDGRVVAGSIVRIVYEGDSPDDAERYLIGHLEEKTGDLDVVSPSSPLGAALIGSRPGDTVEFEAPNGTLRVEVLEVEDS